MGLKFRRGSTAQQSGSLAFGEPYVNTTLGTLVVGGATGDIVLSAGGTGSTGNFGAISGSGLDITGNANIAGNLTLGGQLTIGDQTSDTVNVVASLSSSLIPQTTNAFDLGSATKIWRDLYISTGSIKFVEGTSVVKTLSAATLTALETSAGGAATTGSNLFYGIQTITGSLLGDMVNGPAVFRTYAGTALVVSGGVEINNGFSYPVVIKDNLVVSGSATLGGSSANTIDISGSLKTNQTAVFSKQYGTALEISGGLDINNGATYPVVIKDNLVVSGSTILGTDSSDSIEISGSFKTNQTAVFSKQYGTALEISGGLDINNGATYPVVIKDNLVVSGSTILGTDSSDSIEISGSFKTNQTAVFSKQYGTALEITGGIDINNESMYPARVKNDLVVSGSLYVVKDLTVLGSSSITHISQSTLNIGTNLITVNVNNPAVRFGGISIIDSGSFGSGSFLYDSEQDEFIFVHRGNGSNITSSHFVMGPETYDSLGNEIYLTTNRLPKGTGNEHLTNSNISDDGTTISLGSNVNVTGSVTATSFIGSISASNGVVSGSSQITYENISSIPAGIVSGSSQITYASISSIPAGIVSGSSQITAGSTTNFATDVKAQLNSNTVVSGSSQVTLSSTTGYGTVINQNLLTTSDVRHNSLGIGMVASTTAGRIDASGDIVAFSTSDRNFKENITPIENPIEKIRMISGNTYDWKADMKEFHGFEGNDVGVIAQEIEAVLPQLVTTRETGYKAVKYDKLVALLIEGIKTQQNQIDNLTIEIEKLKESKGL